MASSPLSTASSIDPVLSKQDDIVSLIANVSDPEAGWATRHPDRALAFLYVCPHPCAALDEVMNLKAC